MNSLLVARKGAADCIHKVVALDQMKIELNTKLNAGTQGESVRGGSEESREVEQ
jgi:hypothetical protein